jgi:EAL domain-containing protein (putative c-di-GMP-specific phosphodiesterase class I)
MKRDFGDKIILSKNKIKKCFKTPVYGNFVMFIEVTNLHIYSQFYDITVGHKIFLDIYHDLLKLFDKHHVFLYSSNQIAVIQSFQLNQKDMDDEQMRFVEQYNLAQKVIRHISEKKYPVGSTDLYYTASLTIGCGSVGSIFRDMSFDDLMKLAQFTMLNAKEKGFSVLVANEETRIRKRDLDSFNQEIEKGFKLDEFDPFFIPICDPQTMRIAGFESLVRWRKDQYRVIEASKFKEIALEKNLFEKIDQRVIEKTLQAYSRWWELGLVHEDFTVAINLSKKTLLNINAGELAQSLSAYHLTPSNVEFDVSFENTATTYEIEAVKKLKDCGFKVAYDAAGFQSISLQMLSNVEFDTVKLGYFGLIGDSVEDRRFHLYRTLIKISKLMNCRVLAKGIENKKQMDLIRNLQTDYAEGYYLTKPLDEDNFEIYLNKYKNGIN